MIYDIKKLSNEEILTLKGLLKRYENYDKIDILVESVIEDPFQYIQNLNSEL